MSRQEIGVWLVVGGAIVSLLQSPVCLGAVALGMILAVCE